MSWSLRLLQARLESQNWCFHEACVGTSERLFRLLSDLRTLMCRRRMPARAMQFVVGRLVFAAIDRRGAFSFFQFR